MALCGLTEALTPSLPLQQACAVAMAIDGFCAMLLLRIKIKESLYIASLYSLAITLTFVLGTSGSFNAYRELINAIIVFQIIAILWGNYGELRFLDSFPNLSFSKLRAN